MIRKRFEEKVMKLVDFVVTILWGYIKDRILKACVEVCEKKRGRRSKGDTRWWNEEVKKAVSRKKEAPNAMYQNSTDENKMRYEGMKNKVIKAASKAMGEKAEEALTGLQSFQNGMFRLAKGLKTDDAEFEGGRCVRGSDGKHHD